MRSLAGGARGKAVWRNASPIEPDFCGFNTDICGFSTRVFGVILLRRRGSRNGGSMLPMRRLHALAAIASPLIACALTFASSARAGAEEAPSSCDEFGLAFLASPIAPWQGAPLRVIFA